MTKHFVISRGAGQLTSFGHYHISASHGHFQGETLSGGTSNGVQGWTSKASEVASMGAITEALGAEATASEAT